MYIYTDNVAFYLIILFYFSPFIQLCQVSSLFHSMTLFYAQRKKNEEEEKGRPNHQYRSPTTLQPSTTPTPTH